MLKVPFCSLCTQINAVSGRRSLMLCAEGSQTGSVLRCICGALCLISRLIVCLLSQNPYKILFFLLCDNIIHDKYFVYN